MAKRSRMIFFGGVVIGAIVAPAVMFAAGWIVTSGAASAAVEDAVDAAVVQSLTPICVSQFPQDATRSEALAKLKSLSRWDRPDYVVQSGWATTVSLLAKRLL